MKYLYTIITIILAVLLCSACKKNGNDEVDNTCSLPELSLTATGDIMRPCGIALSANGLFAINEYNGFQQYGSLGKTRVYLSYGDFLAKADPVIAFDSRGAEALAFDSKGNLYVAVYRIQKLFDDVYGFNYVRTIQGDMVNPRGLAFDSKDRLYIANDGVGNILRVDDPLNSDVKKSIGSVGAEIKGLAIHGDELFMTFYGANMVYMMPLREDGELGTEMYTYPDVENPVDIAVDDKIVAISSPTIGKVTLYERDAFAENKYNGCSKEIPTGNNTFGLALSKASSGQRALLAAHHNGNEILYYQAK